MPAELDLYAHMWSSGRQEYVLVPLTLPGSPIYYDIYTHDGTYATLADEDLNLAVAQRMIQAGVELVDPDEWVLRQKVQAYERFWTTERENFLIVREPPVTRDHLPIDTIFDRDGKWYSIYEDDVRQAVHSKMRQCGVEFRDLTLDRGISGEKLPSSTPEEARMRERIVLTLQPALLGQITASMRAVAIEPSADGLQLCVYVDGPLDEPAVSEVVSGFHEAVAAKVQAETDALSGWHFQRVDYPTAIRSSGELVFARYEGPSAGSGEAPGPPADAAQSSALVTIGRVITDGGGCPA